MIIIAIMFWAFCMGFCAFFWASRALITRDWGDGVASAVCVALAIAGATYSYTLV